MRSPRMHEHASNGKEKKEASETRSIRICDVEWESEEGKSESMHCITRRFMNGQRRSKEQGRRDGAEEMEQKRGDQKIRVTLASCLSLSLALSA